MTPAQLRAATSNDRLCFVNAGPGSGKTFLAAEAFGYLRLVRYRDDPRAVAGVTFARSARRELAGRVRLRWGGSVFDWPNTICTFDELHRRLLRGLVHNGLINWPGGQVPDRPEDSWAMCPYASAKPSKLKYRYRLGLDDGGQIEAFPTKNTVLAPSPAFVDKAKFLTTLESGQCTHTDIRNVLSAAINHDRNPVFNEALREFLRSSFCHLIIDEAFDMNLLDIAVVQRAIEAGISVTIVGDRWQSLYEFRGSSPKCVDELLKEHPFKRIDMPGEHRYTTAEMLELAGHLFRGEPFQVRPPSNEEMFDVVLAHDWGTLWAETRISVLPAGKPSKIDGGLMASCMVLLLSEFVRDQFGLEASGVGESLRALDVENCSEQMQPALEALRDPSKSEEDVWVALRLIFQPHAGKQWPDPKKMAQQYMRQLKKIATDPGPTTLGLSVHQAKGLEWENVLFLDYDLTTEASERNILEIDKCSHRNVYVALTRARSMVRVAYVRPDDYGVTRTAIRHVSAK